MTHTEGPEAAQPPAVPGKSKRRQKIVLTAFLIVVAALLALVWVATRDNGENAQVGNCVTESGSNYVKIVDCGADNATLKVVARVEGKTQTEAQVSACTAYPDAEQVFWEGKEGQTGVVLCLAKTGKG
jgi:hypothetical protein